MEDIIEELYKVNVEHLTPEAFRLYEAIMKIIGDSEFYKIELEAINKNKKELIKELSYNKNINKEKKLPNVVDIDYILDRLKEL